VIISLIARDEKRCLLSLLGIASISHLSDSSRETAAKPLQILADNDALSQWVLINCSRYHEMGLIGLIWGRGKRRGPIFAILQHDFK
jgi:hypothetical protein